MLFANSKRLHLADAHVGKPLSTTGNATECSFAKVDDATAVERSPVIPANDYGAAIVLVRHFDFGSEWHGAMGKGKGLGVKAFTIGCCAPVEAWSVVRGDTARRFSLHSGRRKSTKGKGGKKKNSFKHLFGEIVSKDYQSPSSNVQLITIPLAIAPLVPCYASQATWFWSFGSALARGSVRVNAAEWMGSFVRISRALMVCL